MRSHSGSFISIVVCLSLACAGGSDSDETGGTTGSDEASSSSESTEGTESSSDSTATGDGDSTGDGDGDGESSGDGDSVGDGDGDGNGDGDGDWDCDYLVGENGVLMFEAESLAIVEEWTEANEVAGAYGSGYIYWAGSSFNNQPGNGQMDVRMGIDEPGRYRLQWRTQIGMGTNATEHNDVWVRFPDALDSYGKAGNDPETRRYPKPICEDADAMNAIMALPEVSEAHCAEGSTSEGWMKVYSSGATEWKWSARTSDSDAHDIYVEFETPGVYTLQISARADWSLLDRVVLHREAVDNDTAQAMGQGETPC